MNRGLRSDFYNQYLSYVSTDIVEIEELFFFNCLKGEKKGYERKVEKQYCLRSKKIILNTIMVILINCLIYESICWAYCKYGIYCSTNTVTVKLTRKKNIVDHNQVFPLIVSFVFHIVGENSLMVITLSLDLQA